MLGGDVHDTLPIWTYLQVRNILIVLADFLEKIESDRMITTGLAEKLRAQIDRIDHSMKQASQSEHETGLLSMGKSLLPDWQNLSGPASSLAPAEQPQVSVADYFLIKDELCTACMAKLIFSYQHSALYSTTGLHRRIQLPAMGQARPCSLSFGTQHNRHIKGLAPWMPRTLNRHRQIETLRFPCRLYPWPGTLETFTLQTFLIIPQPLKCRLNSTSAQGNRQ